MCVCRLSKKTCNDLVSLAANPNFDKFQSSVYSIFVKDLDVSSISAVIRKHNLKHFRKSLAVVCDQLCDLIMLHTDSTISKLKTHRNKFATFAFVRTCTDTFCTPARFGQPRLCSFCGAPNSEFSLRHLVQCKSFLNTVLNTMSEKDSFHIIEFIGTSDIAWLPLRLITVLHLMAKKKLSASLIFSHAFHLPSQLRFPIQVGDQSRLQRTSD